MIDGVENALILPLSHNNAYLLMCKHNLQHNKSIICIRISFAWAQFIFFLQQCHSQFKRQTNYYRQFTFRSYKLCHRVCKCSWPGKRKPRSPQHDTQQSATPSSALGDKPNTPCSKQRLILRNPVIMQ